MRLVDWRPPLTAPPRPTPDPQHRGCFTEAEGRRLLAELEAAADWITAHGGDFVEITKEASRGR